MECQKCDVKITSINLSRHVRSLKRLKNDPDQTIPPKSRGRPKTKHSSDHTIKPKNPKTKTVPKKRTNNDVMRKELFEQAKDYNIKGYTKWNKQQLLSLLSKVKKLLFKKHDLLQLNKDHLINIGKENNIKVNLRKKKMVKLLKQS